MDKRPYILSGFTFHCLAAIGLPCSAFSRPKESITDLGKTAKIQSPGIELQRMSKFITICYIMNRNNQIA